MSQLDGGAESESDKTGDSEREYFASEAKIQAEIRKENFVFALFLALEKGMTLFKALFLDLFLLVPPFLALFWALKIVTFLKWHFLKHFSRTFFFGSPFLALFWALK